MTSRVLLLREPVVAHPADLDWLSAGERARWARFGSAQRRRQFLSGRWLLRQAMVEQWGGLPESHRPDIDAEGRSWLTNGHASLSHSGEWLAVVVAEYPVGIDLERLRPRRDLPGLARQVHGRAQCHELQSLPDEAIRLERFYRWWTLKEAWLKAHGLGLDMNLMRELEFTPATQGDAVCALLPSAGLVLALYGAGSWEPTALPANLGGEVPCWQVFETGRSGA